MPRLDRRANRNNNSSISRDIGLGTIGEAKNVKQTIGDRHIISALSREHREQLLSDFFNCFETLEESDDVVVLKRRSISIKEQKNEENCKFDRTWLGWLLFFAPGLLSGSAVGGSSSWPEPSEREKSEIAALPPGTEVIEIRVARRE